MRLAGDTVHRLGHAGEEEVHRLGPGGEHGNGSGDENTGSLIVTIKETETTTLSPSTFDINVAEYEIVVEGPGPTQTATLFANTTSVTFDSLVSGEWSITIDGLNTGGDTVFHSSTTATVEIGVETSVAVSVDYIVGVGSLNLLLD